MSSWKSPRLAWSIAVFYGIFLTNVMLAPNPFWFLGVWDEPTTQMVGNTFPDYVQHGLVYAGFMLLLLWGASTQSGPSHYMCLILVATHGVSMETLQYWIPARYFDPWDVVANLVGLGTGFLCVACVWVLMRAELSLPRISSRARPFENRPRSVDA